VLRVSLLGEQTITEAGTGTPRTRSSRTIALIAFLVAHAGAPQSRQRIAGLFWPESTDAQALTNLRRELHQLRGVLGDEPSLVVTSKDLCWCDTDTCRVDVRVFGIECEAAETAAATENVAGVLEHGAAALAEYRGELMPGGYDDWMLGARSQLERQCVELCDLLCQTRARTGDLSGAVQAARRRIALQPLEEIGYRTLMQLQADLGDRAGAVSTYHHCASVLERELGLDPDPDTRQTLQVLLTRVQETTVPAPRTEPAPGRSGLAVAALVGRDHELDRLQVLWQRVAAGQPSLVVVRGDAGVGKTRLLSEIAAVARQQGAVVASTQCFGTSGRLALAPVADWLRNPAIHPTIATLDPVWQVEVDRLVPTIADRDAPRIGSRAMVDAWQRHRFFEGMARALTGAGRPTLLVLDNLQWCDQETLAFLTFYLGLMSDAPVMVAATLRNQNIDEAAELADWTAMMRATGLLTEISLGPLEAADTARLAEAISGEALLEDARQVLQAMTGGFPLYVVEAARTTVDLGSTPMPAGDLTEVLRNRLDQVAPVVRDVAGLAAAVGRNFTLDLLTEASDLDADTVVRAVDELWRRRILREFRDGYDFSHDLLRDTAYAAVSPPHRWLLHRRLAQGLELLHADDTDPVSAQLAEQYARGGRPERALAYYRRAAEVAAGRFAHGEAIRLHDEALSIVLTLPEGRDRDRQELEVLEAISAPLNARYGYSYPKLQRTLTRSIALAETLDRPNSALSGLVGLWSSQFVQGNLDGGQQTVTRALSMVGADPELLGAAHFAFAGLAISLGRPEEALRHFDLAATLTRGAPSLKIGTPPDVHGQAWSSHAHWLLGHDGDALSNAREAIDVARTREHPYSLAVALAYGGVTFQMCGELAELAATVAELRELCDRYGFGYYREWGLVLDGWSRDDDSGIELALQGIKNLRSDGSFTRMPYWLALHADLLGRCGRADAAQATLDAAVVDGRARHDVWWIPEVMRMRAGYDDQDAAVSRLRAAAELAKAHGSVALLRRCELDLVERGVRGSVPAVLPAG
jgi:DNA-binding SARP family transcriptional activator/tetratricopeptide (TPR) repeat protein